MADILAAIAGNGNQMTTYEELYREFLEDRTLFFNAEVDENIIEDFIMYILKWNKDDINIPEDKRQPIKIYFSSPGGNTFNANFMIDVILQSKTPIYGIAMDLVASACYLIYLACHKRFGFRNSAFLQHEGEMAIENSRSKFKQTALFLDSMEQRSKEYILSRTKMTEEFYDNAYEQELWFYADRGVELGVVDDIIGETVTLESIL